MTLDPRDPEIEALWQAIVESGARAVAVVAATPGEGVSTLAVALARRAALAAASPALLPLAGPVPEIEGVRRLHEPTDAEMDAWREPAMLRLALSEVTHRHGIVVIDCPPILDRGATRRVPPLAAAAAADGALLVVLAGRTAATRLREVRERLDQAGVKLIGAALNDRDNPALLAEMEREAGRFSRLLPGLAERIKGRLRRSALLSLRI